MMRPQPYSVLTWPLTPLARIYLAQRRRRGKEHPERYSERRGAASAPRPHGPLVWMHAASVGEATSVLGLIEHLLATRPALELLITTGTVTSARLLETRLPPRARHQFVPADLPGWTARFLDHWRPDLAVWVESELWPNLVFAAHAREIPLVLVNGRLSARSFRRWRHWPGLIGRVLGSFDLCLTQDEVQAERFKSLGASRVDCVGDLKSAAPTLPCNGAELARLQRSTALRPVWLAASTHSGEEEVVVRAHRGLAAKHSGLLTIVAPRHPARGAAIAAMVAAQGLRAARRGLGEPLTPETQVYLVDTIGELGLFYRLSGIAFIGGSLVAKGGHNPFEAARLGCAVLHGPDMSNCTALAASLAAAGAAETVRDEPALARAVSVLLSDPQRRAARIAAATRAAAAGLGVLDDVAARLAPWLDRLAPVRDLAPPHPLRA